MNNQHICLTTFDKPFIKQNPLDNFVEEKEQQMHSA
jgi:hypothetical protein